LLLKYQQVFELIVRRYACCGYYHFGHCEEMLQHVNERVFTKIDRIVEQFDKKVLVRTYLSAICRKIIMEQVRSNRRRDKLLIEYMVAEEEPPPLVCPIDYVIVEEFRRLDRVLLLFGEKKSKLWLLLKLQFRVHVDLKDFQALNENAAETITDDLLRALNDNLYLKDREIYQLVFPFFLRFEQRLSHPDSLRKWYSLKLAEVITLMNGIPARAAYTEDTLQILIEKYCDLVASGDYSPVSPEEQTKSQRCNGYKMLKKVRKK
jgi:DNA-directed RNA polymerase specialized sigma24 family protein